MTRHNVADVIIESDVAHAGALKIERTVEPLALLNRQSRSRLLQFFVPTRYKILFATRHLAIQLTLTRTPVTVKCALALGALALNALLLGAALLLLDALTLGLLLLLARLLGALLTLLNRPALVCSLALGALALNALLLGAALLLLDALTLGLLLSLARLLGALLTLLNRPALVCSLALGITFTFDITTLLGATFCAASFLLGGASLLHPTLLLHRALLALRFRTPFDLASALHARATVLASRALRATPVRATHGWPVRAGGLLRCGQTAARDEGNSCCHGNDEALHVADPSLFYVA